MIVQEPVQASIWHCLNCYDYEDAIVLAERLHVEVGTHESMYLLASAYLRNGEAAHSNHLLRNHGPKTPKLRHLHAVTAHKLGRLQEAESLLTGGLSSSQYSKEAVISYLASGQPACNVRLVSILQETATSGYGVYASFVLKLLGDVYCETQRCLRGCILYRAALAINPFLFTAYMKLMDYYPGEKSSNGSVLLSFNNNNNSTTVNNNSTNTPLDTDPKNIFSVESLQDLTACHGNTLCTVLNTAECDSMVSKGSVKSSSLSGSNCLPHFATPVNSLFTPAGMPGINLIITPSPAAINSDQQNNGNLYQAPRKKRQQNMISGGRVCPQPPTLSFGGSGGQKTLNPQRLAVTPGDVFTPSFGVLPLDLTSGSIVLDKGDSTLDSTFNSAIDGSSSVAVLSPLAISPLDTMYSVPAPTKTNYTLSRRVLCRSTNNNNNNGLPAVTTTSMPSSGVPGANTGTSTPGGSNAAYHHSPSSSHTSVRRSSRLFDSASSVKENNKSRAFAAPKAKSPVRRIKHRALRPSTLASQRETASTPISSSTTSLPPPASTSTPSSNSLTEINNARNSVNNNCGGSENIMPESNILTTSTVDNKVNNSSLIMERDTKPTTNQSQQSVVMISQEELSKQALAIQKNAAEGLMSLFCSMGAAYRLLSRYNCLDSIKAFESLPHSHMDTAFVMKSIAKAYFSIDDFKTSVKFFERALSISPHLYKDLAYYSTALWHLQQEVQLSALSQRLVSNNKHSASGWVAVGNCFSLQKEHESAIKFLSRAIQVEPTCEYAYNLLGHEHIATEELEKALGCFRTAVRINPRHYNAWYGIGLVMYKQEKFSQAEFHFHKALSIHPESCVLLCHIAVVQSHLGKSTSAIQTLTKALALEPNNAMCRYHRAKMYLDINCPQYALTDLDVLLPLIPKEANVYLLLGKAHQKCGNIHLAQMNFSWALDLDPKGAASQGAGTATGRDECTDVAPNSTYSESPAFAPNDEGAEDTLSEMASANEIQPPTPINERTLPPVLPPTPIVDASPQGLRHSGLFQQSSVMMDVPSFLNPFSQASTSAMDNTADDSSNAPQSPL